VLATQNPIEQEGTYSLPEAQLDRFLMHVVVAYPTHDEELKILTLDEQRAHDKALGTQNAKASNKPPLPQIGQNDIFEARRAIHDIYIDEKLKDYIVSLVSATRAPEKYSEELAQWLQFGASPRATLGIAHASRALAYLEG
ncbi:MAG: AAA family ATPase, partial [Phototrophicales bacterium]